MVLPTPVAAYLFNGDANDETGVNDGAISGATLTAGKTAWGYAFDGTNDFISIPNDTSIQVTDYSCSFWVRYRGTPNFDMLITKNWSQGGGYSTGFPQVMIDNANKIDFRATYDVSGTKSTTVLSSDTWYHVVCTFDSTESGGTERVYINGSLEATTSGVGSIVNNAVSLQIGRRGTSLYFEGDMSDVFLFDVELSSTEVTELYNSGTPKIYTATNGWIDDTSLEYGALAYYKMENTTEEVTGNNATGSNVSAVSGIINNGQAFNGTNSTFTTNSLGTNIRSVSFWMNLDANTSDYFFAQTGGYEIYVNGSNKLVIFDRVTNGSAITATTISTGTTYHVVAVFNGASSKVYLNNNDEAFDSNSISGTAVGHVSNTNYIGSYTNGGINTNGWLDEIFFSAQHLSASQVSFLYASGSPGTAQQYPFAAGTPADFGVLKRWNGSGWVVVPKSARKVWNGSSFTAKVWKIYDAGEWKEIGE